MREESTLVVFGDREELIRELLRLADGWDHFGNDRLRDQCLTAIQGFQAGNTQATVGHTEYRVEVARVTSVG